MVELSDSTFESEVRNSKRPVIVLLTARWSAASALCIELVKNQQASYGEMVKVCSLDVEQNPEIAAIFSRDALPAILVFNRGKVIQSAGPAFDQQSIHSLFELALSVQP
ncbi:hypothetical protein FRD01_01405 [Microvenator marinus]|jgi:thioredoxin 1|uniref:Thioredoxin domain-containing protein n=1 Tax=Microvenator marinus TaxID=2600177 RepID=A0A5B8XLH7_9DELT|nr:thioredoxin domain-containing protein [Microvenator marinus]QED25937.1 hypothetical protein FRD01_01405 [Microvenator marinus]